MKVVIGSEYFDDIIYELNPPDRYGVELDIDEATVARWRKAIAEYVQAQLEMSVACNSTKQRWLGR